MKIVIIEDELLTAEDLKNTILDIEPDARVIAILSSIKEAVFYFQKNERPDLIFSDIQLGDGLSFEIFKEIPITTPVIFCTAYDEYALTAFKANGIDYILKPYNKKTIGDALVKYNQLKNNFSNNRAQYESILNLFDNLQTKKKQVSVLVNYKDKIVPIRINEIALFYIESEVTHLITFDQKQYSVNKTIEELEKVVGEDFFRTNRQFLINRKTIKDASQYFARKLSLSLIIPFKEQIMVSKEKSKDFLNWLSGS
ncbi:MAG: DNA-binding response regulator [Bacteroidetes bacterium RIFOXYA12_FULL_35_11]|nr:MAG: DNA-binding response regulator [Bacteroidetes bacterium GWF2_35_48]OFY76527.1 MAG: DNA-binding response regulator [Bacteroidetes bacterium RIFOXYA12_FULL_35_11]OFY95019.1 MAG: DNA-binding response regulator [Bacteroidetes bacterium RIFOXYC12_FULL_35_7]OFY95350.1 MAG: DNA-binding response regulator [Bacteroidetes bacterium RIFOXYB2_FULL_35_7]HBX51790.1 DNA-binding response regulator [Bacteroidales bacterium]